MVPNKSLACSLHCMKADKLYLGESFDEEGCKIPDVSREEGSTDKVLEDEEWGKRVVRKGRCNCLDTFYGSKTQASIYTYV